MRAPLVALLISFTASAQDGIRGRQQYLGVVKGNETAPRVRGELSKDQAALILRRNRNQIRWCYSNGLAQKGSIAGAATLRLTLKDTGAVASAELMGSTIGHPPTEQCLVARARTWNFPRPKKAPVEVEVDYTFAPGATDGGS
jgi:hypothetical protein